MSTLSFLNPFSRLEPSSCLCGAGALRHVWSLNAWINYLHTAAEIAVEEKYDIMEPFMRMGEKVSRVEGRTKPAKLQQVGRRKLKNK